MKFCDRTAPREQRVADYVARVPLAAKAKMMQNGAQPYDALSIPPYQWGSEGLHGPLQPCVCDGAGACKCPTSFPCPSALGNTFNDSLYFLIGQADGREARAINNLRDHATQNVYGDGIDYWSPTINMQRDPRWGRNQEVPGEDPTLTGNYATNFVQGLQGSRGGEDGNHVQIVATCKHFVANSLENWKGHTRHNFNANVSKEDLSNYYLPAFRACVTEGKALGIMCSYNAVNGAPSCGNTFLLNDTLRNAWSFPGYVTSDCGAIADICNKEPRGHGYAPDCTHAAADGIIAGTDMDCGGQYTPNIEKAVSGGLLTESDVDRTFSRLTDIQMRLGLFDSDKKSQPYFNYGLEAIDSAAHQQLALEAAQQSVVLLKNDGVLPLRAGSRVAVVGPHFNATDLFLSNYHGSRCDVGKPGDNKDWSCIQTPLAAVTEHNHGGETEGARGCDVAGASSRGIAAAVAAAGRADQVVLMVGVDQSQEREGLDRTATTLPGQQVNLVNKVLALKKPTVVVVVSGGTMSLGAIKGAAPAIVAAPYGGEMAARAVADVLFGAYNPSGKLAATMYPPDYVDQIPLTEMGLTVPPGRTHMHYTGEAEFEFSHGLSYTTWELAWAAPPPPARWSTAAGAPPQRADLRAAVRNAGARGGRRTVLAFWRPAGGAAAALRVRQRLVSYAGVDVAPGAEAAVAFSVDAAALAVADASGAMVLHPGAYEIVLRDGTSELTHPVSVAGAPRVLRDFAA